MSYFIDRDKVIRTIDAVCESPDISKAKLITDVLHIYMQDFIERTTSDDAQSDMRDAMLVAHELYQHIANADRKDRDMPKRKWKVMVPVVTYEERFADSEDEAWSIASGYAVDVCGEVSEVTEDNNA